jgi:putative ABC transport system permease protein
VFGVGENYFSIKKNQELREGRRLNNLDEYESRKVATIGTPVAENLFPNESPIGKQIEVNGISYTVVGVFHDDGMNGRLAERVYIPLSLFQKVYGGGQGRLGTITYQPRPGVDAYAVEDEVMKVLRRRHVVSPDDRSAIVSRNLLRGVEQINALFTAINSFLWFVGIGTLAAGIVGISNIMMITVKERTVEIGVRKALGARPIQIVSALLFESVLVTAISGYLGLVLGVGLLELVNMGIESTGAKLDYFKQPEVDFGIAVTSIIILVSVGMLAGFAPAWRASKISPVEAMRSE